MRDALKKGGENQVLGTGAGTVRPHYCEKRGLKQVS